MSSQVIQIVILAGIALFLVLQLRKVLGTRSGYEPPKSVEPNGTRRTANEGPDLEVIDGGGEDHDISTFVDPQSDAGQALASMKRREPSFSVGEFTGGARMAYEMILMAFEGGDLTDVEGFLSDDVKQSFQGAIDDRANQGLSIDANFIGVREVKIRAAELNDETGESSVTVRFVGELTSVVRDLEGSIVEGDPNEIKRQTDTWTFARTMGADDPNWVLVATG